jgi:hypothetical protein
MGVEKRHPYVASSVVSLLETNDLDTSPVTFVAHIHCTDIVRVYAPLSK